MKKYLLFVLAGSLFFAGSNELQAKAIKLGRSIGLETLSGRRFQPAANNGTDFCPANCAECSENICTRCNSDYLLNNGTCVTCPSGLICDGTEAIECPSRFYSYQGSCKSCPDNASCADGTVSCLAGFYRTESNDGYRCQICETGTYSTGSSTFCSACSDLFGPNVASACCAPTGALGSSFTCASGYRKSGSECVDNCTGVTCADGYTATVTDTGCDCVKSGG